MMLTMRGQPMLGPSALSIALAMSVTGCATYQEADPMNPIDQAASAADYNPQIPAGTGYFATDSSLPFMAPDFSKITEDDYLPAFEQGMAIQRAEVAAIFDNPAAPSFTNTIVALEKSGRMLGRVSNVFFGLTGSNTTPRLDDIDTEIGPKLAAHNDGINLNAALFARVKAVYDSRASMTMTREDAALLEKTYDDMVHAGALLNEDERSQVMAINSELSRLTTEFSQTVREGTLANALIVDTAEELAGLSDSEIQQAAELAAEKGAPGKYALALQNTSQQPVLPSLTNRETRERLFQASLARSSKGGELDTRTMLARIAALRAQKASLFGKPDWATYTMYDRMAKQPSAALGFMQQMVPALSATQRNEADLLNEKIAEEGKNFTVQPWDWYLYANKVKAEQYAIDEDEIAGYFQLEKVLEDGVFYMAKKLYGVTFERRHDFPTYHPDVSTYTLFEADGSELGLFYFDPFQRPSKRGGAWMSNFVDQSHVWNTKPVIYNVLNIPKAAEGEPQLVSFDNVETVFHEFGHALHGFFADQQYVSLSGTSTARDFVEFPSQVHEMWATHPEVLQNYAKHYETGETIPMAMVEKIQKSLKWNQGYEFGEIVEAALLDMKWHSLSAAQAAALDTPEEVDGFERQSLSELGLEVDLVPPRYRSSYFNHIFSSPAGYSAGYYSYLWSEMLDKDARDWFMENGGLTRENGAHYRETVLSQGGTMDYSMMYKNFAGRDPKVEPMLISRGLMQEAAE